MALQTARYLISSLRAVRRGEEVHGSVRYLKEVRALCCACCRVSMHAT